MTPAKTNSHFKKGSGCYRCLACGKLTRDTGDPSAAMNQICSRCWEMGGDENAVMDGNMTEEEFIEKWGEKPDY